MARTPSLAPDFRRRLLRWFRRHGRDLPWRRTRDPYHVIVSEFMLQQTQVSRVEGYYHRFLDQYPSIESLAAAPGAMVRESWAGLGYYRRAANLHRLAQDVVGERAGIIPSDPAELRLLPGVGRYTAGAVASFAFERSTAAVDTNVARVIRRAFHPRAPAKAIGRQIWVTAAKICNGYNEQRPAPHGPASPIAAGRRQVSIAPANNATNPSVPDIEPTMR